MTQTPTPMFADQGRGAALTVYVLYLLSIPSLAVFALVGVLVALICRDGATGAAREHLSDQLRIWTIAFLWGVALFAVWLISVPLMLILIGFPLMWLVWAAGFAVMLWFTIKSFIGMMALLGGRAP